MHTFSGPVEHALAHIEEAVVHNMDDDMQRWYAIKVFERDKKVIEQLALKEETLAHVEGDIKAAEKELDEMKDQYRAGGLGDVMCKNFLFEVLEDTLAPIRERRHKFEKDIPYVYEVLRKGSEAAREVAAQTLAEVKRAMKINYFEPGVLDALISEQSAKYR